MYPNLDADAVRLHALHRDQSPPNLRAVAWDGTNGRTRVDRTGQQRTGQDRTGQDQPSRFPQRVRVQRPRWADPEGPSPSPLRSWISLQFWTVVIVCHTKAKPAPPSLVQRRKEWEEYGVVRVWSCGLRMNEQGMRDVEGEGGWSTRERGWLMLPQPQHPTKFSAPLPQDLIDRIAPHRFQGS